MILTKIPVIGCVCLAMDAAVVLIAPENDVFDDTRRIGICVIGAAIGAFLSVAIFTPTNDSEDNKLRRLSAKFGVSMLGSITLSPGIMEYVGLPKTPDYLMGVSSFVAIFFVSIIHMAAPKLEKLIERLKNPPGG